MHRSKTHCLFDQLIGAYKQRGWGGQAEFLSGFKIDDQREFGGLLNRQVGRFRTLEYAHDVGADLAIQVSIVRTIADQCTLSSCLRPSEYRPKPLAQGGVNNPASMPVGEWTRLNNEHLGVPVLQPRKGVVRFGDVGNAPRSQLHPKRLCSPLGGIEPILPVRPSRMPKVVDGGLGLVHLFGKIHVLAAQIGKNVAEPRRVSPGPCEGFDKPDTHRVANRDEYDWYN